LSPVSNGSGFWTAGEARTRGEFLAQALWLPVRASSGEDGIADADDMGADGDLGDILDAIVADVQSRAAAACAAVKAECAGKTIHARKYLPRHQAAGAVHAIMRAQAAALTYIAKEASAEIAARRAAAINARPKKRRVMRPSIWGGPPPETSKPG